jgi:L-ascorbate metabolism protein UlaG (beta-lactamase superfamily)
LFRYEYLNFLIDPYLSDFLAKKYKGSEFPHKRMMAPPVYPEQLEDISYVFCTHAHSDHMDPEALQVIAERNPFCRFIVPSAETETAFKRGIPGERHIGVNAGERLILNKSLSVNVIPSAHETISVNEKGQHLFLGFIFEIGSFRIYHSGDCVVYDGLAENLRHFRIDIAFLPVNGRNDYLGSRGIKGNFSAEEAAELCRQADIRNLVAHHFGMFDFNTVEPGLLRSKAQRYSDNMLNIFIPEAGRDYMIQTIN